jgi:iron complex transport system substrate-binding protein
MWGKKPKIAALSLVAIALLALPGCGSVGNSSIEIKSSSVLSSQVSGSEEPLYTRVIALANGSAEIIDSMGLKRIIIGRDIASTDESLKSIPIVTSGHQLVAEKIISLNPDLVIIDSSVGPTQAIEAIKSAGVRVISIKEVWDVAAISSKVRDVASAVGVPATGESLVAEIEGAIKVASKKVSDSPRIAFLYLRGGNSIYLLGGKGSGADSMLEAIGAVDVGAVKGSTPFAALTSESLVAKRPDIILVMSKGLESVGGVEGLVALPGVAQTPAGQSGRVIAVDDSLLLSFGPRTPALLAALATAINEVRK